MTQNSHTSKPSTGSDTDIKRARPLWHKLGASKTSTKSDVDQLFDIYWGGPERRITGLTIKIIGVNAVALIILALGILYLGQYQDNIIEAKLETFKAEVELISAALSEGAVEEITLPPTTIFSSPATALKIEPVRAKSMARTLGQTMRKRIRVFDADKQLIADSHNIIDNDGNSIQIVALEPPKDTLYTVEILRSMAAFIINLLPDNRNLPLYPKDHPENIRYYPDAQLALQGETSFSAWMGDNKRIVLSAAAPILKNKKIKGATLLTRSGEDIEDAIAQVWSDILKIFFGTLLITILLSIYLSGTIARPLRRLANAAEKVRSGKNRENTIPNLSYRKDEIGELSLVLQDMTQALWDRMDTIEAFAADVSHELKNPLTSLKSAIETLAIVKKPNDRKKLLEIIQHDAERLDRLITDISNASKLDTELSKEEFTHVDLNHVLSRLLDAYKDPLERVQPNVSETHDQVSIKGVTVSYSAENTEPLITLGLEIRLNQVFQNLITNAVSFSNPGQTVSITAQNRMTSIVITVDDEGPGIPEAKLSTIFERFYSERPEHEAYGRHSGLGLSICKQIIEAHRGRIFAENKKENGEITGAKFTVILSKL